jgi:uncharacterized membrane protein
MWRELWNDHKGKCIGVAMGLLFGFVYLFFGFWDMVMFALLVLIGFAIGRKVDRAELKEDAQRWFHWLNERWNLFR